jgi:hypothetical protein
LGDAEVTGTEGPDLALADKTCEERRCFFDGD